MCVWTACTALIKECIFFLNSLYLFTCHRIIFQLPWNESETMLGDAQSQTESQRIWRLNREIEGCMFQINPRVLKNVFVLIAT